MPTEPPPPSAAQPDIPLRKPVIEDGAALWALAAETGVLDVNSPYAYLLWCRDFSATSVVAEDVGVIGFVTGYRRPDAPDTLVVWQVAVSASHRGLGLAGRMLDHLVAPTPDHPHPPLVLETTITDDNAASRKLFTSFAERHGAGVERSTLFGRSVFPPSGPDDPVHEPEVLHRIGPLIP